MSEVQRFWSHEASNIRCVREADFDRVTAERDALQQRLTAADEREDALCSLAPEAELALKALNVAVSVYDVELADSARRGLRLIIAALKPAEPAKDEHVCTGCGSKGWTANCAECVPY